MFEKTKINEKEAGVGPFFKKTKKNRSNLLKIHPGGGIVSVNENDYLRDGLDISFQDCMMETSCWLGERS